MLPPVPEVNDALLKRFLDDLHRMLSNMLKLMRTPDDDDLKKRTLVFSVAGNASAAANVAQRIHVNFPGRILKVIAYVKTAPVGASIIFDVNKNGNTIWTTQANRVAIAAGGNDGEQTSFDSPKFVSGDVFTLDIDQVGSSTAGTQVTVEMEVEIDI